MDIVKSTDGHHTVSFKRGDKAFLESRNMSTMADVDWASIMQYASIVMEAVMLVLSAIGVSLSVSSATIEETTKEVAAALKISSQFVKAVQAFVDAWHAAGGSAYEKAKALFSLVKNIHAAGVLCTVIKSLYRRKKWYEWLAAAAKVIAMLIVALATKGATLIAEIALIVLRSVDFARKLKNISQLKEMKSSKKYVDEIFNIAMQGKEPKEARKELEIMTPAPMNTMLEKQPRNEARAARKRRKSMSVQEVPRTVQVNAETESSASNAKKIKRSRTCKNPMKGHKNVKDCPKNMST